MPQNIFDKLNNYVNNTEGSIVNFFTVLAPWLAPLPPAAITYSHMREFLEFERWLAFTIAALVEILGFSTVSTALSFWFHNQRDKTKLRKAPFGLVIGIFCFYLSLLLLINVVIDISSKFGTPDQLQWSIILVRGLLTLQTIPAAIIIAVRTGHRNLLAQVKLDKQQKLTGTFQKSSETPVPTNNKPKDWRSLAPTLTNEDLKIFANLTPLEVQRVAKEHQVSERTVTNWRHNANIALKKKSNGNG